MTELLEITNGVDLDVAGWTIDSTLAKHQRDEGNATTAKEYVLARSEDSGGDLKMFQRRYGELADAPTLNDPSGLCG
jgi:hypothetical protein